MECFVLGGSLGSSAVRAARVVVPQGVLRSIATSSIHRSTGPSSTHRLQVPKFSSEKMCFFDSSLGGRRLFSVAAGASSSTAVSAVPIVEMQLARWDYCAPGYMGAIRTARSFCDALGVPLTSDVVESVAALLEEHTQPSPKLVMLSPLFSALPTSLDQITGAIQEKTGADVLVANTNGLSEFEAADAALHQIIKHYVEKFTASEELLLTKSENPSINIIGTSPTGFHHLGDTAEMLRNFADMGIEVNLVVAENISVDALKSLPKAWLNLVPYRESGLMAASYLQEQFQMPMVSVAPMGILQMRSCFLEIQEKLNSLGANLNLDDYIKDSSMFSSDAAWFARSIDCQNLMAKRGVIFGDATHAAALTKILVEEMDVKIVLAGTYCTQTGLAEWFRKEVGHLVDEVLISSDPADLAGRAAEIEPDAIFGTQIERQLGAELRIPTGVISSPTHLRNARISLRPLFGYEGTNQISDLIYNSFTLGMEDHLLEMFGGHDTKEAITKALSADDDLEWTQSGLEELYSVPGFVRGKVKRNTEKFAREQGIREITAEVMYKAKEAVGA